MLTSRTRQRLSVGIVALVSALLAAACSSSGGGKAASPTTAGGSAQFNPAGVLRVGENLQLMTTFDPSKTIVADTVADDQLVFGTLLQGIATGPWTPGLAQSATIVNPSTISVTLRSGLVFSDGTPLDAQVLAFTINRNRVAKAVAFRPQIHDVSSVAVTGPLSITIHLSRPIAGAFYPLLSGLETMPVSPNSVATLSTAPIGAGPFLVKQFRLGQEIVFSKNSRYWDAKDIKLGGIDIMNFSSFPATISALRVDQIDAAPLDVSAIDTVKASGLMYATATSQASSLLVQMCKSSAPLNNVQVRQALSYATDRQTIVNDVLRSGQVQWGLWPDTSPLFPQDLNNIYPYDPAKARQLLTAAGYPSGLHLTVVENIGIAQQVNLVLQQEWKQAGIDLTIVPSTNSTETFNIRHETQLGTALQVKPGIGGVVETYALPTSLSDVCGYQDPAFAPTVAALEAAPPGSAAATNAWHAAQDYIIKNALSVYIAFVPVVIAWNPSKVGGMQPWVPWNGTHVNYFTAYVK